MKESAKTSYIVAVVFTILFTQHSYASVYESEFGAKGTDLYAHTIRMKEEHCSSFQDQEICCSSNCSWNETERKCLLGEDKRKEIYLQIISGELKLAAGFTMVIGSLFIIVSCFNVKPLVAPLVAAPPSA